MRLVGLCLGLMLTLTLAVGPAGATDEVLYSFPLTGAGGVIFSHAQAPPTTPVETGTGKLAIFDATPEYGHVYLWMNGVQLFNRPGVVFENAPFATDWIIATKRRPKIWDWRLDGKINDVVIGHQLKEADQGGPSLDVAAITSFAIALVVVRRQVELEMENMPQLGNEILIQHPDFPTGLLPYFLSSYAPAKMQARFEAIIYLASPDRSWGNGSKAIAVGPFDDAGDLPVGIKARKKAVADMSAGLEKRISARVREILDVAIKKRDEY